MSTEKQKFKKFYSYGSVLWLLLSIIFYFGKKTIETSTPNPNLEFLNNILTTILIFGVFGIPFIFLLSLLLRFAEYVLNKLTAKKEGE